GSRSGVTTGPARPGSIAQSRGVVDRVCHRHRIVRLRNGTKTVVGQQTAHRRTNGRPSEAIEIGGDVVAFTLETQLFPIQLEAMLTPLRGRPAHHLARLLDVSIRSVRDRFDGQSTALSAERSDVVQQ